MTFDVIITSFRMNARESASQVLERAFGIETERARALVRKFPATVIEGTTRAHADNAAEQLREAGAKVEIVERTTPSPALEQAGSKLAQADTSSKATAKTEAIGSEAMQKIAAIAKKLQDQKLGLTQPAAASTAGAAPGPAGAQASELASNLEGAAPRKMFSTVAMQNIEADLQRFEVTDFGPPPPVARNDWADSIPPGAVQPTKAEASQPQLKLKAGKPGFPDVDELFAPPPSKGAQQAAAPQAPHSKGDDVEGLFSPPGADKYYKSKAEVPAQGRGYSPNKDAVARPLTPRGEDKIWRPPAQDKSLDQGSLAGDDSAAAKEVASATLKTLIGKVAAGVVAATLVAGVGMAVLNARAANTPRTVDMGPTETKAEWLRKENTKRMHPVIRMAPASIAPAFAGILRQQVDKVFHVQVEWDGAPKDLDCMLVAQDKKAAARMTKLMRTGEKVAYPPEAEGQFEEHLETLRMARGKPNERFEKVCLSVAFLDDSPKPDAELSKAAAKLDDDDEDDEDKGEATINGSHQTAF